jgi:hypothetical protein
VEWSVLEVSPKVKFLAGDHRRERVISSKEEALYLAAALPLLHDVSTILFDTGMRPEECHSLKLGRGTKWSAPDSAMEVPLGDVGIGLANLRTAVHRAAISWGLEIGTLVDENNFYVWKK